MAKKVTLQDAKSNNLFPTTTVDQILGTINGSQLFEFDSANNVLGFSIDGATLNAKLNSSATAAVDTSNLTENLKNQINNNKIAGAAAAAVILAKTSDTGIWVGTDTNKWYYWDSSSSAYAVGGDFITTAATKIILIQDDTPTGADKDSNKIWINEDGTDNIEVYSTTEADTAINNFAPQYSATKTYAVGDYCIYDNPDTSTTPSTYTITMYRCNTAITTAEAWNSAHWTAVNVGARVKSIEDQGFYIDDDGYLCQNTKED